MAIAAALRPPGIGRIASYRLFRNSDNNYLRVYSTLKARFGDLCTVYLPHLRYLVFHPDDIRHCLRDNYEYYSKGDDYRELQPLFGEGLVTSDGALWRDQRRLLARHFQQTELTHYQDIFVRRTSEMLDRWSLERSRSAIRDITADFGQHAFAIAGDAFFGAELAQNASIMRNALDVVLHEATVRAVSIWKFPLSVPTPANVRYRRAVAQIDRIAFDVIKRRPRTEAKQDDLLSALLNGSTAEGDERARRLVRDQLVTFMIAGHETSAVAMAWTLGLLSQKRDVQEQVAAEVSHVLGSGVPSVDILGNLKITKMVIQEAMRLYPPAPVISRCALRADCLRGYPIKFGSSVTFPIGVTHRDPQWWDSPDEFKPARFEMDRFAKQHPCAYMPFGTGARSCIGEKFAYNEMLTVISMVCQRFVIEAVDTSLPEAFPKILLHPVRPILIAVRDRR